MTKLQNLKISTKQFHANKQKYLLITELFRLTVTPSDSKFYQIPQQYFDVQYCDIN